MENTPEVENKYTELSSEEKKAEYEKLTASFSDEDKASILPKTEEKTETKPEPKVETEVKTSTQLNPQIEKVAQTLMSQGIQRVNQLYKDFDVSGIIDDPSVDTLTKVTLLSTVAEPNAIKMATIEKNLKNGEDAKGTQTETKSAEFSANEKEGKVNKEAGKTLWSEMCDTLGIEEEKKTEKTE